MAKFVLDWDSEELFNFRAIGMVSSVRPHRLVFAMNQVLPVAMFRDDCDLSVHLSGMACQVPLFRPMDSDPATDLVLLENYAYHHPVAGDVGLFAQSEEESDSMEWDRVKLIKNLKQFDYFLLIFGTRTDSQLKEWAKLLRSLEGVVLAEEISEIESISGAEVLLEIEPNTT